MQLRPSSLRLSSPLALAGLACALVATSCSDESTPGWWKSLTGSQSSAKEAPAKPAATTAQENDARNELLDYMIFTVGEKVNHLATQPEWTEEVRGMRSRLEDYYNKLEEKGADLPLRVRLSIFLADSARNLRAYAKASEGYQTALKNWENLPADIRTSITGRRLRSAIANGTASCLLMQNKAAAAQPYYETALKIDEEIFNELAPDQGQPLPLNPGPELERAAEDVLSSYRCLAECLQYADDPEEARETFQRGHTLATRMKHLKGGMSIQYIRLLSALGNLESRCGQLRQAQAAWTLAANLAQRLRQATSSRSLQAQAQRYLRELEPSIKSVNKKLKEEAAAAAAAPAAPDAPAAAPAAPEEAPAS